MQQDERRTLMPALTGRGVLRVHLYSAGEHRPEAMERPPSSPPSTTSPLARMVWFQADPDPVAAFTRVQLHTFDQPALPVNGIEHLDALPEPARHLRRLRREARRRGLRLPALPDPQRRPVLTAVRDGLVVGAIGPMETMPDPIGKARPLPQFGVLPAGSARPKDWPASASSAPRRYDPVVRPDARITGGARPPAVGVKSVETTARHTRQCARGANR